MNDLEVECFVDRHYTISLLIAFPALIIWGIGIPGAAFILMYNNFKKKTLFTRDVKKRFGFLYLGYEKKAYYWELIITYRKIAIVFISVFLVSVSVNIQGLATIFVMSIAYILHVRFSPYTPKELDKTEFWAIVCGAVTLYCGMYFLLGNLGQMFKWILFIIILIVNIFFITYWAGGFIKSLVKHLHEQAIIEKLKKIWKILTRQKYKERIKWGKLDKQLIKQTNIKKFKFANNRQYKVLSLKYSLDLELFKHHAPSAQIYDVCLTQHPQYNLTLPVTIQEWESTDRSQDSQRAPLLLKRSNTGNKQQLKIDYQIYQNEIQQGQIKQILVSDDDVNEQCEITQKDEFLEFVSSEQMKKQDILETNDVDSVKSTPELSFFNEKQSDFAESLAETVRGQERGDQKNDNLQLYNYEQQNTKDSSQEPQQINPFDEQQQAEREGIHQPLYKLEQSHETSLEQTQPNQAENQSRYYPLQQSLPQSPNQDLQFDLNSTQQENQQGLYQYNINISQEAQSYQETEQGEAEYYKEV